MKTTFPTLYHIAKKATYSWKVWTEGDTVYTEYGQHPDGEKQIGKMLKVKFFEYTKEGISRFPVGIGFRDMEIDG